jgi:hypothetical protein
MAVDYLHGRILYKFLKRKNALYNFFNNVVKDTGDKCLFPIGDKKSIVKYLDAKSIGGAFVWYFTPEGSDYWENLDNEFEEYINSVNLL